MNLLPEKNKIFFKKHYLKRLFAVFGILIFSIIAAGGVILMPMQLLILSHKNGLNAELEAYAKKDVKLADSAVAIEIKKLNNRLSFAGKMSRIKKLNSIFKNILDKKNPGVKITFLSYENSKEPDGEGKVYLSGNAETRDDMLIFENRLKKEFGSDAVISPVSNLINEKDFNFSLTLRLKNEK